MCSNVSTSPLSAPTIVSKEYDLDKIVKPYVILKRNGLKIGVFGLSPQLDGLVDHKNYRSTEYLDPVKTAQEMADILKEALRPRHLHLAPWLGREGYG